MIACSRGLKSQKRVEVGGGFRDLDAIWYTSINQSNSFEKCFPSPSSLMVNTYSMFSRSSINKMGCMCGTP